MLESISTVRSVSLRGIVGFAAVLLAGILSAAPAVAAGSSSTLQNPPNPTPPSKGAAQEQMRSLAEQFTERLKQLLQSNADGTEGAIEQRLAQRAEQMKQQLNANGGVLITPAQLAEHSSQMAEKIKQFLNRDSSTPDRIPAPIKQMLEGIADQLSAAKPQNSNRTDAVSDAPSLPPSSPH